MGNLEEEIKQSSFKNNAAKAILNVMYTSNWIRDSNAPFFKEYNILQQHYNVLRIVRGRKGEPVSPGQIIKVMLDKGRDLTRLVDKLVKIGYLQREPSPSNRRKIDITITEKGLEVTNAIESKLNQWLDAHIKLSNEEAGALNDCLDKMRSED